LKRIERIFLGKRKEAETKRFKKMDTASRLGKIMTADFLIYFILKYAFYTTSTSSP
jgi:hypothetical protein